MGNERAFNPFPGLRPFEAEEDYLFFGREKQIDELLRRLRSNRFLAVIGTSGSGKSSLVRAGLIPSLEGGYMVKAGSNWRVAKFRPGADPIRHLAEALSQPTVLGTNPELAETQRVLLEATLERSTRGLIDAVRQARIPEEDNVLIVVDQFEELFRFRHSRVQKNSRDEALAFVKLLLEAIKHDLPIYVVVTMRSDFIGDSMEYPGLPEAINSGLYLVPRMTRDELRSAITGPVAVGGAQITPRLVLRLLNDVGDDQDLLPVLQHALMRTWEQWQTRGTDAGALDLPDYESVGTMRDALSNHAEEAFRETASGAKYDVAECVFKALTDTYSDDRGVRRPTSLRDLVAICDVAEADVVEVIEAFRRRGRSFLMPPPATPLTSETMIDISHESLMRCWTRLIEWAEEERNSAQTYSRISQAAKWFEEGSAALWRDPELELGLRWRHQERPTAAWARRYDGGFERAMRFLDQSAHDRDRLRAAEEKARKRKLREYQWAAGVLATLLVISGVLFYVARVQKARAETYLELAKKSVDEMLSSAGRQPARVTADVPEMEAFRRELLEKAQVFYAALGQRAPSDKDIRADMAKAHFRLGDINRLLEKRDVAADQYRQAITQFSSLVQEYPKRPQLRDSLADAYNWLGETLRPIASQSREAEGAYDHALQIQQSLVRDDPKNVDYKRKLARSYYNRGIVRYDSHEMDPSQADFRQAIEILQPLAQASDDPVLSQELARAYNDLGNLLRYQDHLAEAQPFLQRAVDIHERLTAKFPENREYKYELASFTYNEALLAAEEDQREAAQQRNQRAFDLLNELARPATSLSIALAKSHNLAAQVFESNNVSAAEAECERTLTILQQLATNPKVQGQPEFQRLYRDLGYNYLELAHILLQRNSVEDARRSMDKFARLIPELSGPERDTLKEQYQKLQNELQARALIRK